MLILKHLHDWSFDELEQEVRANLVYRAFTRIGIDAVPDAKTILKIAKALGPEVITDLHQRVAGGGARPSISHRYDGCRNECALSNRQHPPAGRRAGTEPSDAGRAAGRGSRSRPVRNRLRQVTRLGLAISRQARTYASP